MVTAGTFGTSLPNTASHEGAGTVVAVGQSVKGFQVGDRVLAGLPHGRCGICTDCQGPENYRQYCNKVNYVGVTIDGAFAEYMLVDARESMLLPDRLGFESAVPLACAGITVWRGVLQSGLKAGETLCIVGSGGGLGHLGIQFAKALGLRVIAIDARDEGLGLSRNCGADSVLDARLGKEKVVEEVKKVTNGGCADATVNVSDAKEAAALACAVTKVHGLMIQIAQPAEVCIPFVEFIFRDIRVHGSLISSKGEAQRMLDLVVEHDIKVKTNAFHGLKELPKAVELAHSGKMQGKPVILIDEEALRREKESGLKIL
ncbi:MAG: hypothetical protein M1812_004863 [Candelaria pacifica]|nr:MAG: hypothetical protein M1812_004863 [Candelaria pacifica]